MINPQKKQQFIQERYPNVTQETQKNYFVVIRKICEAEDFYGTDLCNLSNTMLNALVEKLSTSYVNYARSIKIINDYNEWCGSPNRATISFKSISVSTTMTGKYFGSFAELDEAVRANMDYDKACADAFYSLIIYLVWIGMSMDEIVTLRNRDIDATKGYLISPNKKYVNVNQRVFEQINFCNTITSYETNHQPLVCNDYVIRRAVKKNIDDSEPGDTILVTHALAKFNKATCGKYTFNTIRKSGLFAYLYALEQSGEFKPNDDTQHYSEVVCYSDTISKYFGKDFTYFNGIIQDYKSWKKIYNLEEEGAC